MNRIFKYPIQLDHREMIQMPRNAKILSVALQNEMPMIFAMVDPDDAIISPRIIRTVSTGEEFGASGCEFIGTIMYGAPKWFSAHVFEQTHGFADTVSGRYAEDFRTVTAETRPRLLAAV